ncbi:MAG: M1 family metallopeptidase, partial [Parvularculaceae bacterium]|nr:M1 family metallopeptidase [Parvularculaceae bacterium]
GRTKSGADVPAPTAAEAPALVGSKPQAAFVARDPFTYSNYDAVRVTDLALDIDVMFDAKVIDGAAILAFERLDPTAAQLVLDSNDLDIKAAQVLIDGAWAATTYALGADDENLGSRLAVDLPAGASKVKIAYRTNPHAEGLQWLAPEQTGGKKHPFMYSQNQAINARSMAPVQDTPAVRMTYSATVRTPKELVAVMSAGQDAGPRDGEYRFSMPQPVPAYLLAIAVGDLEFRPISDTIGVYAEPDVVDAAAREFADTPRMETAIAALYGPYRWGRYDLLVLPPSFPFGGMENPRLSFLTPTLIAGDKSLVGTVAHELAHSWSGNLVTNKTWSDAWLNEGVTSYVENRAMEAVFGRDRAVMEQALALADLKKEIEAAERPEMTQLRLPADLEHPDDAFSDVAYVKGQFFLHFLEARYGRAAFDAFLKSWFDAFAFKAATTDDFRAYLMKSLVAKNPDAASETEIDAWLFGQGLPSTLAAPVSAAFDRVEAALTAWTSGNESAAAIKTDGWTTQEWLHFINSLPADFSADRMKDLDLAFDLSNSKNSEIAFAWYMKSIDACYAPALPAIEAFLTRVGRGKFLYPLYEELTKENERAFAERVFEKARPLYHPIAERRVAEILQARN